MHGIPFECLMKFVYTDDLQFNDKIGYWVRWNLIRDTLGSCVCISNLRFFDLWFFIFFSFFYFTKIMEIFLLNYFFCMDFSCETYKNKIKWQYHLKIYNLRKILKKHSPAFLRHFSKYFIHFDIFILVSFIQNNPFHNILIANI